jgi:threonine dehydrogenase-like Zn-dependent dehydrogenase
VVLVGAAGKQTADWSLVWHRELTVVGTVFYGPEPELAGATTFRRIVEWLDDPQYLIDGLVTHTFDLSQWTQALDTADAGPGAGAVKVTLRTNPDLPLIF